ncbi:MAG: alpha-mannosidase [Chloroflexi bacterium]|nr:alpha-mannosidase [Chloroflexota bacterium]
MRTFTVEKIEKAVAEVRGTLHRETVPIPTFRFIEADPPGAQRVDFDDSGWGEFHVGERWGGYDVIAWFRATVEVPEGLRDRKLALRFLVGPRDGGGSTAETMLYVNGAPLQGIGIWHEEAWLPPETYATGRVQIALRAWSSVLDVPPQRHFKLAYLAWIDERAERFFFLADPLIKSVVLLDANDWRRIRLLDLLHRAVNRIDFLKPRSEAYYASLGAAADLLESELRGLEGAEIGKPRVVAVGHSHIDVMWLWRLKHTREKAMRTFATVLHLMRQYPEYRFLHTTPQLFKYLQQDAPDLFEQVRQKVAEGAWEITGGMWVESDTNLPSGESLIRQILYGKRYVRETFGKEMRVLWMPDVFGYSAALPQILKKSGIDYFLTTKLSWNQFNRFPFDTFRWRGIDGSEVLAHFVTTPDFVPNSRFYTYNGDLQPKSVKGLWDNYASKPINDELLLSFGWGDGGGGPTREMIETARTMRDVPGFPTVETGTAEDYFQRLEARLEGKDVPVWDGELYLEYHRGTYTSQAATKRANRQSEVLLHDAEWLTALADMLGVPGEAVDLIEAWELLLLNQFHDLLPGSSIRPVYEDSALDFARISEIGGHAVAAAQGRILSQIRTEHESAVVFNTLSWSRHGLIEIDRPGMTVINSRGLPAPAQPLPNGRMLIDVDQVSQGGYTVFPLVEAGDTAPSSLEIAPDRIETPRFSIHLNERGQIVRLVDKAGGLEREVLAPGGRGNVLQVFEDKPLGGDAWDIDPFFEEKMREADDLVEAVVEETGPLRGVLRLVWRFADSTITQRLTVYAHTARIDFRTEIDWHEQQVLLKAAFPVNIRSTRATYDIQFGRIERPTHRNTSWDAARFEVPAHKYFTLSEPDYGVSLLNDGKYGCDVHDNVMRLSLLRSPTFPDPQADQGRHVFTYSLIPGHLDWPLHLYAYDLNYPLRTVLVGAQPAGNLPAEGLGPGAMPQTLIVETFKRAEDGDGWIVRVYEPRGAHHGETMVGFGRPLLRAVECNLIEEGESSATCEENELFFAIGPFEIKTFRVWF